MVPIARSPSHPPAPLRRVLPGVLGIVLFGCLVGVGAWLMERPLDRGYGRDYHAAPSAKPRAMGSPFPTVPAAAGNAADATPFAVQVGTANTAAGAMLLLELAGPHLPVGTYVPTAAGSYRILVGAFQNAGDAAALLASLRSGGQLSETSGAVVRVPLAYMIEQNVPADSATRRVAGYAARGLPVYALRQADGRARVYAGAFAAAADTGLVAAALRRAGVHATLAYRTGRPF